MRKRPADLLGLSRAFLIAFLFLTLLSAAVFIGDFLLRPCGGEKNSAWSSVEDLLVLDPTGIHPKEFVCTGPFLDGRFVPSLFLEDPHPANLLPIWVDRGITKNASPAY